jgi:Tfp pilus assembly protein PilV
MSFLALPRLARPLLYPRPVSHAHTGGKHREAGLLRLARRLRNDRGASLVEVLVSSSLLVITIAAVFSSLAYGVNGVESSREASTAVFLAEQRLEQVRAFAVSTAATQGFINLTSASFAAEAYGSLAGYANFRRTVTVTANAGNADLKLVQVTVAYKPASTKGFGAETSTTLTTLVSRR